MNCYKMHCYAIMIHQLPNCNLFTHHIIFCFGETPLVKLWTPVHLLYTDYNPFNSLLFAVPFNFVFHHSFNLFVFSRPGGLTTFL